MWVVRSTLIGPQRLGGSHSASARSTARSNGSGRIPYRSRASAGVAREQVGLEALHQRAHQLERLAGHRGDHGGWPAA